ncbi:MAG: peptidase MA family metallohydrolase, partial [Elusimicrobiota bacterium]
MRDKNHAFGSLLGVFVFLLSLHASDASAFGKNKVITEDPRWQVRATRHFDIHFTPDAAAIVPRAAYYLENAYERITRDLDIRIEGRTPFFLFSDHNRFEENNIADVGEGTGGVTEAFKNRFIVFNNGTEEWLDHVITHEFGHVAEFEILYGGFWKSIRLLKSPLYPLWLMEGYAEYVVGDMDKAEEDLVLRDAATSGGLIPLGELHGFNHLKPNQVVQAYKQGAAAVRYLAREYGPESVANLLKSLRDRFEPGSLLVDFTGLDFAAFDRRYREFLTDHYTAQSEGWLEPEAYGDRTSPPDLLPVFNTNPVFSPDGLRAAYLSDASGERQVMIADLDTGARRALAGRQWGKLEHIHGQRLDEGRALSFSPDGRWLAFAGEKKQRDYLYLYDLKRDRLRRLRPPFEQIRSPVFHPRGDRLAVVGLRNGTNDLYEVTTRGKLIRRLTESPADENDPSYSPDGETLVYSQEVFVSSAAEQGAGDPFAFRHPRIPPAPRPERVLMRLDLATLAVSPLTDMPGDEVSP